MNPFRVNILRHLFLALFVCVTISAFPTEKDIPAQPETKTPSDSEATTPEAQNPKKSQPVNTSSISTTSSLLFKDKKPILTYLLGQPKNTASLSSPAQLLSPDRYEFFTFDDDGQIVKKLMSVKEIQKIIANNEKGPLGDHGSPVEYYQILTVTPDVESIPSVSRINPNEPLFSIHDVIASVQNVLKSEIKIKQSQPAPQLNGTSYLASASSDHFEIITENPPNTFKVENKRVTSPASQSTTNAPPNTFIIRDEVSAETEKATTQQSYTFVQESSAPSKLPTSQQPVEASTITHVPVPLVSSSGTPKPVQLAASSASQTVLSDSSTQATVSVTTSESKPLSLADAHPGLISNETFLDMKPFTVEQISRIAEPIIHELKTAASTNPAANFVKIQTVEPLKTQNVESSTPKQESSVTPDLADSVSSVLWQIASENSMLDTSSKPTESVLIASSEAKTSEPSQEQTIIFSSPASTTELPTQSRSTEKLSESPLVVLENILRPQNQPRPFQKIPLIEKGTPEAAESRIEPVSTTPSYEPVPAASSTVVILTEKDDSPFSTSLEPTSTSAPNQGFVVSVSPDAVVQSPEHLKPVTDKVSSNANSTNPTHFQQAIDVQVIQEANIGQIPRTTEFPGQIVKDVERKESPNPEFVSTEESLADSASNTFSTQLPYVAPEVTTVVENIEERTEISEELGNVEQTTIVNLEPVETKTVDDVKETSASDRVDITFIPMLIKTPSDFKQEESLKVESQAEVKEEPTVTEKVVEEKEVETTEATEKESLVTTTLAEVKEEMESKESIDSGIELKNEPKTTTETVQKETVLSDDGTDIGTLKQNIPIKPLFGKPSKPVYIKPVKTKTPTVKPSVTAKPFGVREPDTKKPYENHLQSSPSVLELEAAPDENLGLEATVANLDGDIKRFADLCNELAFSLWSSVTHNGLSFVRSVVVSPFAVTSLLAMVFLGARGPTSGQMNDVLRLDDMVTFNPHLVFRNVTESLVISRNPGVATTAFVRELYSDKSKGKLLDFYKERVQQFYDGHVEEVNFKTIGDTLRRQTNHLVKRQTWGKITDFLRGSNLMPRPPLAAFSANIFQTDCSKASTKDRDGEMYFVILPSSRLRRLVPIPAVVWRDGFLAGYEPTLDATAVSINPSDSIVSTIFVLPGQQGLIAPGDTLARLEHHLLGSSYKKGHWSRLMRSLLPRPGLELQIPRLSHKSVINVTSSLQRMGLKDLFNADKADLTGLNGLANDLHLSDMLQVNLFSTCGEEPIGSRHHSEVYPATPILRREKSSDHLFSDSVDNLFAVSDFEDPAISALPLELRPRQARVPLSAPGVRIPEPPRLRFDRPFLFFVRHNPTGLILHMGRFNPRLMP